MWRLSRALKGVAVSVATLAIGALVGKAPMFAEPQATATGSPSTNLPTPAPLRLQETTELDWTAPNATRRDTKCDADGNVFIQFGNYDFATAQMQLDPAISEVIPVYALISTRRNASDGEPRPKYEYYVEQLKEDITTDSMTRIQAPPGAAHWSADLLGVFPKGNFLIAGESSEEAGRASPGSARPFTAIYDSSGRFLVELTLPEDVVNHFPEYAGSANGTAAAGTPPAKRAEAVPPGASEHAGAPAQSGESPKPHEYLGISIRSGGVVGGPGGNLWILRASDPLRLYAVDAAGQVVKHFQFSPPVPGLTPLQFGFAGPEQIFFDFGFIATDPSPHSGPSEIIGVFDMASEQFNALYTLPSTEIGRGAMACGDGRGGFTFLGSTPDRHLAVFDYR